MSFFKCLPSANDSEKYENRFIEFIFYSGKHLTVYSTINPSIIPTNFAVFNRIQTFN